MAFRRRSSKKACHCSNSPLQVSSSLLFLSLILPRSSYAQITNDLQLPTTFATSSVPTSPSTQLPSPPPTPTSELQSDPSNAIGDDPDDGSHKSPSRTTFNYYFLIVAVAAIIFCLGILWLGKRKKQKAAIMRTNSQRALERDVAGFRARTGRARNGNGRVFGLGARREQFVVEGLDERGEAPPPYALGTKPPSLRSTTSSADLADRRPSGSRNEDVVELRTLNTGTTATGRNEPPEYHEHMGSGTGHGSEDIGNITRPTASVVSQSRGANDEGIRPETTRRLLDNSGGSAV